MQPHRIVLACLALLGAGCGDGDRAPNGLNTGGENVPVADGGRIDNGAAERTTTNAARPTDLPPLEKCGPNGPRVETYPCNDPTTPAGQLPRQIACTRPVPCEHDMQNVVAPPRAD